MTLKESFPPSLLACLTNSIEKPVSINLSTYAKHWFYEGKFQTGLLNYFNKKPVQLRLTQKLQPKDNLFSS